MEIKQAVLSRHLQKFLMRDFGAPPDAVNIDRSPGRIRIGAEADCINAGRNIDTFRADLAADSFNRLSVIQRDHVELIEQAKEVAARVYLADPKLVDQAD